MKDTFKRRAGIAALAIGALALGACSGQASAAGPQTCVKTNGDTIKIGFLNSFSGTMAVSERPVNDSLNLAVKQINESGGVNGKQIVVVTEDGQSDPETFAAKADKLVTEECVAAVFGGWTSTSRQAMKPVFESTGSVLYYPLQYEGQESSTNIIYTGATTNQQVIPALDFLRDSGKKKIYLLGSDYVFPRTSNQIVRDYAAVNGMEVVGETYVPLGEVSMGESVAQIAAAQPDVVFNTLNGDSNIAFFREFTNAGLNAQTLPVMSTSVAEDEVHLIGAADLAGHFTTWNYYQSDYGAVNGEFVYAFKEEYGHSRVTSDPMESAYTSVFLWKATVEKSGSFDPAAVLAASGGVSVDAPEGKVTIDAKNNHVTKTARIGQIQADGSIATVWASPEPIQPDPFLKGYPWAKTS